MARNIIEINGRTSFINYDLVRQEIESEAFVRTCEESTILLFNKFPITSTEAPIDLVFMLNVKEEEGNYIGFKRNGAVGYIKNVIIPIRCIDTFQNDNFILENENNLLIEGNEVDFFHELSSMKFGLTYFLQSNSFFEQNKIFIYPVIFLKSNRFEIVTESIMVGKELSWKNIFQFIQKQDLNFNSISSYLPWKEKNNYEMLFPNDIKRCVEVAALIDSNNGYLTKRKLDRIANRQAKKIEAYNEIGERLLIIKGKAGTGKTNELLGTMIYVLSKGRNAKYLTYNNLLVFDVALLIKQYLNNRTKDDKSPGASVLTIHKFFYRLARQFGVLLIMSEPRAAELIETFNLRSEEIEGLLFQVKVDLINFCGKNYEYYKRIKENIVNANADKKLKQVAISFVNFSNRTSRNHSDFANLKAAFQTYYISLVRTKISQQIFTTDYYHVLKKLFEILSDAESFYTEFDVVNRASQLSEIYRLDDDVTEISQELFLEKVKRKIGGFRRGYYLFVDEAQDCHRLERDILIKIFGGNKIVVVSGGKEQLIRHGEVCRWDRTEGKSLPHHFFPTGNVSHRTKKNVLDLCNFVATKYFVKLNLKPLKSDDVGQVIVDFRPFDNDRLSSVIDELLIKGEISGCTPYESLLAMVDTSSLEYSNNGETNIYVNEFDNIEEHQNNENMKWKGITEVEKHYPVWDGTNNDKGRNDIPYPGEVRLIHYESCRGLEAWTTTNVDIDLFFERKASDDDAEKYLLDTLLPMEERKKMYAATWLLMVLTRAVDTIYLTCRSKDSELGKLLYEYARLNTDTCRIYE